MSQRKNGFNHCCVLDDVLAEYEDIRNRLDLLQNKIIDARSTSKTEEEPDKEPPESLLHQFAEYVEVVGLIEAIESPRRIVRYIWAILFFLGLAATIYFTFENAVEYLDDPTATVVKLIPQAEYEYPPLTICPQTWINSDKVLSMGLSMDAIKYSLAYASIEAVDSATDIESGRMEFLKFYHSRNYASLFDYFHDISVDLTPLNFQRSTLKSDSSIYACYRCKNRTEPLEKVFIDNRMCYVVQFEPEKEKRFRNWNAAPEAMIRVKDGKFQTSGWRAYITQNKYSRQPHHAYVVLAPNQVSTIKMTIMRLVDLSSDSSPCVEEERTTSDSKRFPCITECMYEFYMSQYKCRLFPFEPYDRTYQPFEYCNYFDKVSERNFTHYAVWTNVTSPMDSHEADECVEKCPQRCDKRFFTSVLDSQLPILGAANSSTATTVGVRIDYIAVTQGGILTLTEISTLSWVAFVSNIGGTLGLFIGGTVMTVFQILMVVVNYFLDVRGKRKKEKKSKKAAMTRRLAISAVTTYGSGPWTVLESNRSDTM